MQPWSPASRASSACSNKNRRATQIWSQEHDWGIWCSLATSISYTSSLLPDSPAICASSACSDRKYDKTDQQHEVIKP